MTATLIILTIIASLIPAGAVQLSVQKRDAASNDVQSYELPIPVRKQLSESITDASSRPASITGEMSKSSGVFTSFFEKTYATPRFVVNAIMAQLDFSEFDEQLQEQVTIALCYTEGDYESLTSTAARAKSILTENGADISSDDIAFISRFLSANGTCLSLEFTRGNRRGGEKQPH